MVFAKLGGGVTVRVVPQLTEHPGAEDDTKSWQAEVDVGVRVCLKMCRSSASSSVIWRLSSMMMPTAARVVVPNAAVTGAGAASCSMRSTAAIC